MPAIRPHQKTRLHLRDSATVDFGPEVATLTVNGTVSVADDVFTFPGSASDYLDAVQAETDTSTTVYSVSGWFNADSVGAAFQTIVVHATGGSNPPMLVRLTTSSTLQFSHSGVSVSSSTVSAGTWYHFAAVWDGTNIELFLNGVSQGTAAYSTTTTLGTAWEIGNWTTNNTHYAGKLADLRFNNFVLTTGEVFDLYNGGRGYDLPERKQLPDTVVHVLDGSTDAGFYGEELTLEETTYENGVYTLSGTTPRIDMGQTRIFNEADGFAFAGWFKPTAVSSRQFLWCHGTATYIEINPSTSIRYKASDNVLRSWSYTFAAGETYHIAVSNDGAGNAELWINGTSLGTIAVNGSSTFSFSEISINNASLEFQGDAWDNRVFDRPLTAGEVANLYHKGIPAIRDAEVLRIDPARYSGSGDLIDQTGGGNDLTLPSGYTVTDGVIVSDGTADGPDTGVSLASSPGTIAFWINTTDTKWDGVYGSSNSFALISQDGNGSIATGFVSNAQIYVDGVTISNTRQALYDASSDGTWRHVAITGDFGSNFTSVALFQYQGNSTSRLTGQVDKLLIATEKLTADQIAFLASSREFADPFPEPFLGLGGETLNIQPSRYSGNGDLLDESGNGNDQTLPSGYSVADGVISSDGSTDGPTTGVSFTGLAASAGMWVKSTDDRFIGLYGGANTRFGMCWQSDGTGVGTASNVTNMTLYVDGVAISDDRQVFHDAAADGTWHHVAVTGDFVAGWNNNTIGTFAFDPENWRYTGELDDIRFEAGRKWSAEEIKLLASSRGVELPNTRDAKLYVSPSYDDASNGGTSVIDYSGSTAASGQPTFGGTPTWTADTSPDNGRSSLVFDSSDSVSASAVALPGTISEMSALAWVKVADLFSRRTVLAQYGSAGNYSWRLVINTTGVIWFQTSVDGTAQVTHATSSVYDESGDWFPIIVTWDQVADECKFYVSGTLVDTRTGLVAGLFDAGQNTQIGIAGAANPMSGSIDDVALFNRVLTPAEIAFFSDKRNPYGTPYTIPGPGPAGFIPIILF